MKTTTTFLKTALLSLMMVFALGVNSQNPTYFCNVQNEVMISPTVFQFDIYIYQTGNIDLYLSNYALTLKADSIAQYDTLTGIYVAGTSQLPPDLEPDSNMSTITFVGKKYVRANGPPAPSFNGFLIPLTGLRIGTFQVIKNNDYVQQPVLTWSFFVPVNTSVKAKVPPPNGPTTEICKPYFHAVNSMSPNTFKGTVFNDINNNGIKDGNETGIPNILIKTKLDNWVFNTDAGGNYTACSTKPADTIYIVSPSAYATVSPADYAVNISDVGKNFAVYFAPNVKDLKITVTNVTPARPGFTDILKITYENAGTVAMSGNVTLDFNNGFMSYVSSNPTQSGINGNIISWDFTNLLPSEKRNIAAGFLISPATPISTVLNFTGIIYPVSGDSAVANNYNSIEQIVTGSFDPNDKEVIPGNGFSPQQLAAGEKLVYTIHFQNTGNDTAFTVKIKDTLNANLDASTFEMLSSSHPCKFTIKGPGIVEFVFSNILLPDSNVNFIGSNGFVKYAVKPLNSLLIGDSVTNTAYIYFDFNAPVQTNTVSTLINTAIGITEGETTENGIYVYPNPAKEELRVEIQNSKFQIQNSKQGQWKLYNTFGSLIAEKSFTESKFSVDVSKLAKGLYLLKIENGDNVAVKRFIKE